MALDSNPVMVVVSSPAGGKVVQGKPTTRRPSALAPWKAVTAGRPGGPASASPRYWSLHASSREIAPTAANCTSKTAPAMFPLTAAGLRALHSRPPGR